MGCGNSSPSADSPEARQTGDVLKEELEAADVEDIVKASLARYGAADMQLCKNGCGRPSFGTFETCCTRCPDHHADCEGKLRCSQGCGRWKNRDEHGKQFMTCCRSCPHLKAECGLHGHDLECDVRDNGGKCPPWYWTAKGPDVFHEEVSGDYVRKMGTKLLQQSMPEHEVVKCCRVERSDLWNKYAIKREEIRKRAVKVEDIRPKTADDMDFSATTTLDHRVNECWLFHGTSEEAAQAIATSNFRLPETPGLFGKGAYFAEAAKKSHHYAKKSAAVEVSMEGSPVGGCHVMLLCRVTLGNMWKVDGTDRQAEELVRDPAFDSVLGESNFREFIVYDVAQVYPEYIMYYKLPDPPQWKPGDLLLVPATWRSLTKIKIRDSADTGSNPTGARIEENEKFPVVEVVVRDGKHFLKLGDREGWVFDVGISGDWKDKPICLRMEGPAA